MKLIKTKGIVLKEINFEESSKILTVFTSEFWQNSSFVKKL